MTFRAIFATILALGLYANDAQAKPRYYWELAQGAGVEGERGILSVTNQSVDGMLGEDLEVLAGTQ